MLGAAALQGRSCRPGCRLACAVLAASSGGARGGLNDAPVGRTGLLEIAGVNDECSQDWRTTGASDTLATLRSCCERDVFLCWDMLNTFEHCCELVRGGDTRLENISGVHLVTYGSRHFARRAHVLAEEGHQTGWFTTTRAFTPEDLDLSFQHSHGSFMRRHARLGGYGIWKPQIILQAFRDMKDGEVLLYLDAGCQVNVIAGGRFQDYLRATEQSPLGMFTFTSGTGAQRQWTKADLADRIAPYLFDDNLENVLDAPQHITGIIFVQKNEATSRFMHLWQTLMGSDYSLIDDRPSRGRNISGFVEHRHDQSVFSMMLYANDHRFHIRDETLALPEQKWAAPILASRLCGARHFLQADREEWLKVGCIERPGFMPRWASEPSLLAEGSAAAALQREAQVAGGVGGV